MVFSSLPDLLEYRLFAEARRWKIFSLMAMVIGAVPLLASSILFLVAAPGLKLVLGDCCEILQHHI